ncbi:MAG TPA: DUF4180 domain-containing protein [Actinophytocola sp.]|jgi:hypothetical protein|nr:DUF4180 domain-containing protein [Actinophytocola sp.]
MHSISETHGLRVLTVAPDVPTLGSEADALDLVGLAFGEQADLVVVPVEHVDPAFFTLSTRVAGDVVRKFGAYRIRLVVLGDLGEHLASDSFRAFVHEINRGSDIWFLDDRAALDERLRTAAETLGRSR